jgi:hypothetical protein
VCVCVCVSAFILEFVYGLCLLRFKCHKNVVFYRRIKSEVCFISLSLLGEGSYLEMSTLYLHKTGLDYHQSQLLISYLNLFNKLRL